MTVANAIIESYKRWDRKPSDVYPTPVDGTESLVPVLKQMRVKRIWEPACGDGRLSRVLEWHGFEVTSTDLRENPGYGVGGLDFINEDPMTKWGWDIGEVDMIVTNPPFALSVPFVKKALSITPNVAMLVKVNYWNTQSRYGLFGENRPQFFFPLTWRLAFLEQERGKSPLMDCAWCVWTERGEKDLCAFEPMPRLRYPGYSGRGLRGSAAALCEELDALTGVLRG